NLFVFLKFFNTMRQVCAYAYAGHTQKIDEVDKYLQKILLQLKLEKPKPVSLKGIWKNKGFDKIVDLEAEIKKNRNEINDSILKKGIEKDAIYV
ncbi:MAG: hypothetical protein JEY97_03930, partial [Bacteroidales bacterium]|nr:hypothetical protein [Bacteroidales bacterium]